MRSRLNRTIRIAGLVRDIGVILGVPVLLGIGLHFWDLQTKAHEAQIKAYILSTGCQWRALPKDLPPRSTVHDYLDLWSYEVGAVPSTGATS
jgi:Putative transposase of IS4/5 family (DUF4096)